MGTRQDRGKEIREAMIGQRFGMLVVIGIGERADNTQVKFQCVCDCGGSCARTYGNLKGYGERKAKGTQSCGCDRYNHCQPEDPYASEYKRFVQLSKDRRKPRIVHITKEEYEALVKRECGYCGEPPAMKMRADKRLCRNGIDRIDNDEDYTLANSVPCCATCNDMKRDRTYQQFKTHCEKVSLHNVASL